MGDAAEKTLVSQLRRNTVALISLVVAITALSYNTWRNELTEYNRNVRAAGFEILTELAELQLTVDFLHYESERDLGNPIRGWARVLLIRDLALIMPSEVQAQAAALYETWRKDWDGLGTTDASEQRITEAIQASREAVLKALKDLD